MTRIRPSKFTIDALHRSLAKHVILFAVEGGSLEENPRAQKRVRFACVTLGWSYEKGIDWAQRTIAARKPV